MAFKMPTALAIQRCDPELRSFTKSGGRTGTGREQRVFSDAGFWTVSFDFLANTRERVLAYRAMIARLRQGEEVIARICDAYTVPAQGNGTTTASAAVRATSLQMSGIAADMEPGVPFSISDRLHRVTEVTAETSMPTGLVTGLYDGGAWDDGAVWVDDLQFSSTVKFLPPLRAAVPLGSVVRFTDLTLLCVLQDMADGDLSLQLLRHGTASLTLVESI